MSYSGDQKREYQLNWLRNRKFLVEEKLGGHCVICGSTETLEVDHINWAEKHPSIKGKGFPYSWAWTRIEKELEHCQLLCKACHEEKTFQEKGAYTHGTRSMYKRHQCRCNKCTNWNTLNMRKVRERKRLIR